MAAWKVGTAAGLKFLEWMADFDLDNQPRPRVAAAEAITDIEKEAAATALQALWDCGVASGMDTDGDTRPDAMIAGMGITGFAAAMVEDVRQLRRDYDEELREPIIEWSNGFYCLGHGRYCRTPVGPHREVRDDDPDVVARREKLNAPAV